MGAKIKQGAAGLERFAVDWRENQILHLLSLSGLWIFMAIIVDPRGDFPLNDDWSFGSMVRSWVTNGELRSTGPGAMTRIFQIVWGALFCFPFGFSYTALRISTLTLGLVGVLATYELLRLMPITRPLAFFGAVVMAVNPLYFNSANTFMTDVPFLAFMVLALWQFVRGVKLECQSSIVWGGVLSSCAILIRQLGVSVPLSFALVQFLRIRLQDPVNRKGYFTVWFPAFSAFAALTFYKIIAKTLNLPTLLGGAVVVHETADLPLNGLILVGFLVVRAIFLTVLYSGLFMLPFLIPVLQRTWLLGSSEFRRARLMRWAFCFGVLLVTLLVTRQVMPLTRNLIYDFGLGPPLLRDSYILKIPNLPSLPRGFWYLITGLTLLGSTLLIDACILAGQTFWKRAATGISVNEWIPGVLILSSVIYLVPISMNYVFYDRYVMFFLPIFLVLLASQFRKEIKQWSLSPLSFVALILALFLTWFSIGGTHDYLSWNRARWQALHYLIDDLHVPPRLIDGGYEFNGLYNFNENLRFFGESGKSWWWVDRDDYVIAFGSIPGYEIIRSFQCARWLPRGKGSICILHKQQ